MTFPKIFNVNDINGKNGFAVVGSYLDSICSVAALGDINGDGKSDLIIGIGGTNAYVVFGSDHFPLAFYTSRLNGENGFTIMSSQSVLSLGMYVAGLGDLNGDGFTDFAVNNPGLQSDSNEVYVIFGSDKFEATLDVAKLDGINGFTIIADKYINLGMLIGGVGDINNDGKTDIGLGTSIDQAYVLFGKTRFPVILDVSKLNANDGFKIIDPSNNYGVGVFGAGDVNGDGVLDLVVGMGGINKAFVIFGATSFPETIYTSRLDGTNGFTITSNNSLDFGGCVIGAFDINGDGKSDICIGALDSNEAFVLFGASHFPYTTDMSILNGTNGFQIIGSGETIFANSIAGLGSVNGNGKSSLLIGASLGNHAFVIFGADTFPAQFNITNLNGTNGFEIIDQTDDYFGLSVSGISNLTGTGNPSFIIGAGNNLAFVILNASYDDI